MQARPPARSDMRRAYRMARHCRWAMRGSMRGGPRRLAARPRLPGEPSTPRIAGPGRKPGDTPRAMPGDGGRRGGNFQSPMLSTATVQIAADARTAAAQPQPERSETETDHNEKSQHASSEGRLRGMPVDQQAPGRTCPSQLRLLPRDHCQLLPCKRPFSRLDTDAANKNVHIAANEISTKGHKPSSVKLVSATTRPVPKDRMRTQAASSVAAGGTRPGRSGYDLTLCPPPPAISAPLLRRRCPDRQSIAGAKQPTDAERCTNQRQRSRRDGRSGRKGLREATERLMHGRQGRLATDEHASGSTARGSRQRAPERSSSPSSPAGSADMTDGEAPSHVAVTEWAISDGETQRTPPSRVERASDAHPPGGGQQQAPERSRGPSQLAGSTH